MNAELIKISTLKKNPDNPRIIKDDKFKKLVESIESFPEMLKLRPIVYTDDFIVLGGNMRLEASKAAGLKEVWAVDASHLTSEQQREFIIKDNVGFGEWDWDMLGNEWESEQLQDWGLDVPTFAPELDYSLLEGEDVSGQLSEMTAGVKKAIQIEFESEDYEKAYALVKFWREKEAYVGGMIMEYLKSEKEKS